MSARICITSSNGGGSWRMRGEQLGAAVGATVRPDAASACLRRHDIAIAVKRIDGELLQRLQTSGVPWVWDIVDAYPQDTQWRAFQARDWFRAEIQRLRPHAVIWPSQRMRMECGPIAAEIGIAGPYIPHQPRPGIAPQPLRDDITVIGYDGMPRYLESLHTMLEIVQEETRARLVYGPQALREADVMLSLRGAPWDGHQMAWKPAVKLANAQAAGLPLIGEEAAFDLQEPTRFGAIVVREAWDIVGQIDLLRPSAVREAIRRNALAAVPTLEHCAGLLREFADQFAAEAAPC